MTIVYLNLSLTWIKILLFCVNILFMLAGGLLIHAGLFVNDDFTAPENPERSWLAEIIIATGISMIIGVIIGFFGIFRRHGNSIFTVAVLLMFIFILEVLVVTFACKNYFADNSAEMTGEKLDQMMSEYYTDVKIAQALDSVQDRLRCCGAGGKHDWNSITNTKNETKIPNSCCQISAGNSICSEFYVKGCVENIEKIIKTYLLLMILATCAAAFVQISGIIIVIKVGKRITKNDADKRREKINNWLLYADKYADDNPQA